MLTIPQPAAPEVPTGEDDTENVLLRKEGEIPQVRFRTQRPHRIGQSPQHHRRRTRCETCRFAKLYPSRRWGSSPSCGSSLLAQDIMIERGYTPMVVPVLVREDVMYGTGYFPVGRDQAYLCERDEMSLVGTAEVPLTAYYSNEELSEDQLPIKILCPVYLLPSRSRRRGQGYIRPLSHPPLRQGRAGGRLPK